MTIEEAIRILDPETGFMEVSKYSTCNDSVNACREAGKVAADELRKRQWISVKDRLPKPGEKVLACLHFSSGGDVVDFAWFMGDDGWMYSSWKARAFDVVTHWQPIPELPKEG